MTTPPSPFAPHPDDEGNRNARPSPPPPPPPPHQGFNHQAPLPDYVQRPQHSDPYAAPPQPSRGYQQYQPYGFVNPTAKNWLNTVSLVAGVLLCVPLAFVAAIVLGHLGIRAANRGEASNKGLGIAGLVLGYLGLVITVVSLGVQIWWVVECSGNPSSVWCEDF